MTVYHKYQRNVADSDGTLVPATINVDVKATALPATVYSDEGVTTITQPFTATGGLIEFWARAGVYEVTADDGSGTQTFDVVLGAYSFTVGTVAEFLAVAGDLPDESHVVIAPYLSDPVALFKDGVGSDIPNATGWVVTSDHAPATLFGAVGDSDGITASSGTDDGTAINAGLAWMVATGKRFVFDRGLYFRTTIALGATGAFDIDATGSGILVDANVNGMVLGGYTAPYYALTANYTIGSKTLTVSTMPAALTRGTIIKVRGEGVDPANRDSGSETDQFRSGETAVVGGGTQTTTTITLEAPLQFVEAISPTSTAGDESRVDAYTTALTARVWVPELVTGRWRGGFIRYRAGMTATGWNKSAFDVALVDGLDVKGLTLDTCYAQGINLNFCPRYDIRHCAFYNFANDTSAGQFGYMISESGGFFGNVSRCRFHNGRHAFTTNAAKTSSGATEIIKALNSGRKKPRRDDPRLPRDRV